MGAAGRSSTPRATASSTEVDAVDPAAMERVIWLPVRHHSPAAARAAIDLIQRHRPEAVLIEGPAEFTEFDQLRRKHTLPIAIMPWLRYVADDRERQSHALYPLTEFSAEWQAIVAARRVGATVAFIDLPWVQSYGLHLALNHGDQLGEDDAAPTLKEVRPGRDFFATIAEHVGREDLSAVWDEFFEIDPLLDTDSYLKRAHAIGAGLRLSALEDADGPEDPVNVAREAHMAARIAEVLSASTGQVLVLTGAFHTYGLQALLRGDPPATTAVAPAAVVTPIALPGLVSGTALVPTSYETLDAHRGYLAGQPSPGFYHRLFSAPADSADQVVTGLFTEAVAALRRRKVPLSAADAIAAMTTARGLQQLRGHPRLWRDDLIDGITAAVVKDDLDDEHPLLTVLRDSLRGNVKGTLARGTAVPPLVTHVRQLWTDADLPQSSQQTLRVLDLNLETDRQLSQLFHSLRVLDVPAVALRTGHKARMNARASIGSEERWGLRWDAAVESSLIFAARWGGSLDHAVTAVLDRRARLGTPAALADVLTDAVRAGLNDVSGRLGRALTEVLSESVDLGALGTTLDALVRLVHFDTWLGAVGRTDLCDLTRFTHERATAALERLGPVSDGPLLNGLIQALRHLAETTVTLASQLHLDEEAVKIALRAQTEHPPGTTSHDPEFEGALIGAGWLLSGDPDSALRARLSDPAATGRFYSGLLAVAGHLAIASPQVFFAADDALRHWDDETFLSALPDLRRAMRELTSRERGALLNYLTGQRRAAPRLTVDAATLVTLGRRESRVWDAVASWTGAAS